MKVVWTIEKEQAWWFVSWPAMAKKDPWRPVDCREANILLDGGPKPQYKPYRKAQLLNKIFSNSQSYQFLISN